MNHAYGWMGGGMWIWTVIGALVVVLLPATEKLPRRSWPRTVVSCGAYLRCWRRPNSND
jgi:hypothetical protein